MAITDTYDNYRLEVEHGYNEGAGVQRCQKNMYDMLNDFQPRMKEITKSVTSTASSALSLQEIQKRKVLYLQHKVFAPQRLIMEVLAWSGAMAFASSLGSILGAYVFYSVFAAFLPKFIASILAYIVIPAAIHASIKHKERQYESDYSIRRMMIISSFGQGLFVGYTIGQRHLSAQPLAFITPVVASFGYSQIVRRAKGDRIVLLGGTLGPALAVHMVLGIISGRSTSSYEFLSLGYVALTGVAMQMTFQTTLWSRGHVFMNIHNALYNFFKGMTFYCFGTYIE